MSWPDRQQDPFHNAHQQSDLDRGPSSQHHTLGKRPNQASPGDHNHGWKTGDIKHSFAAADGIEWVESGSIVSRSGPTAKLFALFGTTYGVGNGTTTFQLPSVGDRFLVGTSAGKPVGSTGGADASNVVLTEANLPPHSHGMAHTHPITRAAATGGNAATVARGDASAAGDTNTGGASNNFTGNGNGTSTPVNVPTIPKYLAVRVHIKT